MELGYGGGPPEFLLPRQPGEERLKDSEFKVSLTVMPEDATPHRRQAIRYAVQRNHSTLSDGVWTVLDDVGPSLTVGVFGEPTTAALMARWIKG